MKRSSLLYFSLLVFSQLASIAVSAVPVPHFELSDENTNSPRFQENVAPEEYRQQVSLWYFGAAT